MQSNIRELEGALNKIIALAQLYNTPIRMELAVQALSDAAMEARRAHITPELVVETVIKHFKCSPAELRGTRTRQRDRAAAPGGHVPAARGDRRVAGRDRRTAGGRDHSTVMHGIDKMEKHLESDTSLRNHINAIRELLYAG